jgi:DNA-binding transcriptional regulator/RsmH inhibitor MraZ
VLKKAVDIKNEIVIAGVLNKIEIWPKELYESQLKAMMDGRDAEYDLAKMSEEAFALLGEEEDLGHEPEE